jgi:hypothetical protein
MSAIRLDEHVFVAGRTGTGKTFLARKYFAHEKYVVVHDTKGSFKWPEVPKNDISLVRKLADLGRVDTPKIIYRPRWEEHNDLYFGAFYEWIFKRRNCRVIVDELMQVCPSPFKWPDYLKAIYTQGRELGVTACGCTQRPTGIPQICISEATHLFIYDLNLPQDRTKLVEVTGIPELWKRPGKRNFWYYNVGQDQAVKATLVVSPA